jgi:hypothetical protein
MTKTLERIGRDEDKALSLGDLKTALRLNWLRNAVRFDGLDNDTAEFNRQCITFNGAFRGELKNESSL